MLIFTITKAELLALEPCWKEERIDALFDGRERVRPKDAHRAGVSAEDFLWVLSRTHPELAQRMALKYAELVSHLNPDPRVQEAIDAARKCIDNPTEENRKAAKAAWAAATAAWAAAKAARAAAKAAWATAEATWAAAEAAAGAAWAAAKAAKAAGIVLPDWIDIFGQILKRAIPMRRRPKPQFFNWPAIGTAAFCLIAWLGLIASILAILGNRP